jgi:hypothetical protein
MVEPLEVTVGILYASILRWPDQRSLFVEPPQSSVAGAAHHKRIVSACIVHF